MDFPALFILINNVLILPFGDPTLAGVFWVIASIVVMGKIGLGIDACLVIGGGTLMLISITMLSIDMTGMVVAVAMILFGLSMARIIRK